MKKYRKTLILSGIVTLLPMLIGFLLWNRLPGTFATHWGPNGNPDGWMSKFWAVTLPPVLLVLIQWLCMWITGLDPKNRDKNEKAQKLVLWIIPAVSIFCSGLMYATALDTKIGMNVFLCLPMGALLLLIGNILPKCSQNSTIGIKLYWTLANRENWNKTHSMAGKLWMLGGAAILLCVFLPEKMAVAASFAVMITMVLIPIAYSCSIYRAHRKAGVEYKYESGYPTWLKWFSGILLTGVLALVLAVMCLGNVEVTCGETAFAVEATFWQDLTVEYAAVDSVELLESCPVGERTGGFGSPRLLLGNFRNEAFGNYTRYSCNSDGPAIVIRCGEDVLVLALREEADTKLLYETLLTRIG